MSVTPLGAPDLRSDYFWVTRAISWACRRLRISSAGARLLTSVLASSAIAYVPALVVGCIVGENLFTSWQLTLSLSWLAVGPVVIDAFELAFDTFSKQLDARLSDAAAKEELRALRKGVFDSRASFIYAIPLFLLPFSVMSSVFRGHGDAMLVLLNLTLLLSALMWGVFLQAVIGACLFVRRACRLPVNFDVFHADGLGGLAGVGSLSLRTAALISSVSVYIPVAALHARNSESELVVGISLFGIAGVIVLILLTFGCIVYPVYTLARKSKMSVLHGINKVLRANLDSVVAGQHVANADYHNVVIRYYKEVQSVRVWPLRVETIINIVGLIGLPIAFFFLDRGLM